MADSDTAGDVQSSGPASALSVASSQAPVEVTADVQPDVQPQAPAREASPANVSPVDAKRSTPPDQQESVSASAEPAATTESPATDAVPAPALDVAPVPNLDAAPVPTLEAAPAQETAPVAATETVTETSADTSPEVASEAAPIADAAQASETATATVTATSTDSASNPTPAANPIGSTEPPAESTSTMPPILIDDGEDNEDNLSPPPSGSVSPPSSYLKAQTPKGSVTAETVASGSPMRANSDDEQANGDSSGNDNNERSTPYTRRKRSSMFDDQSNEKSPEGTSAADEVIPHHPLRRPGQTNTAKLVLVGYWRASTVPAIEKKHSVVCFIDTRDRLRTRVQTTTRKGHPVAVQYPMPSGGSWVPFDQIVFEDHLVGLDQAQIKEYVKIRTETMETEASASDPTAADHRAVEEAIRRVKYGSQPDSGMPIAYGADIPDQPSGPYTAAKRRRTDGGFVALANNENNNLHHHVGPIPFTSVGIAQNLQPLDPLPGTRPTRILIGYWHGSSETEERDRHAVYGILGQNDMFRVKVVRETRDGRFVDGNFPSGAGALWIHYEEVILEPQIMGMSRHEVKEYCRVRQWQIDRGESDEERRTNESFAVQEAQARVAHGFRTGQIVMMSKPPDDKVHLVPQISSGTQQYHELRPAPPAAVAHDDVRRNANGRRSLPDSRVSTFRAINDPHSAEPSRQLPVANTANISSYNGASSSSAPASNPTVANIASQAFAAVNIGPGISHAMPAPVTATIQPPGNGVRMRFHDPPSKVPLRRLDSWSHKDVNRQQSIEQERLRNVDQERQRTLEIERQHTAEMERRRTAELERQRSAELERQRSTINSEDAIIYAGVKYEKKKAGPFKDRHVSQGTIISINGEDYVEYRVLTKPTFF